ncbi:MAG TPA: BCAM0308 family protein [Gammaproteobacteria bacterium]|nr:BCAM0308 family protein [Gammaproteobacteria bacterium]
MPRHSTDQNTSRRPMRQDRLIRERIHDPYKLRQKLPEPTRCPRCGAVFEKGRWAWSRVPVTGAHEELCQACHRIEDDYPAGEVHVRGAYVSDHKDEIVGLMRNIEQAENAEHPLNRIMRIDETDEGLVVKTTDIHLPHAIGHALNDAWDGELAVHYDEEGYFARVEWRRDA